MPKEKTSKHVKCDVLFDDNCNGIFKAGDKVSGTIELQLTQIKKVRGISLLITGFSSVFWEAKVPNGPKNKKVKAQFKGNEDFIKIKSYLVGSDAGETIQIRMGVTKYPFEFTIPPAAPTSMEGKFGHIRYLIKVALERPWKYDHNFQKPFTVLCAGDLNSNPEALGIPTNAESMVQFYCGLCRSRPLIVTATTPKSGYVPGETIELEIFVQNESKVLVNEVEVKFQKVIKFISQSRSIGTTQVPIEETNWQYEVLEHRKTASVAGQTNTRFLEKFVVGPITPSEEANSRIVKICYELSLLVKPQRSTKKMKLIIPITVGTIPLAGTATAFSHVSDGVNKLASTLGRPMTAPPAYVE